MSEILTQPHVEEDWLTEVDRRRPGRAAEVSPVLVGLLRAPASQSARLRVAAYDAPGFLLQPQKRVRRPRSRGFSLRATGAVAACGAAGAAAIQVMCWAWG